MCTFVSEYFIPRLNRLLVKIHKKILRQNGSRRNEGREKNGREKEGECVREKNVKEGKKRRAVSRKEQCTAIKLSS